MTPFSAAAGLSRPSRIPAGDPGSHWASAHDGGDLTREEGVEVSFTPSGQQFELSYDEQRAVIVEVGGGVRAYVEGSRPVLDPYPQDAMSDGAHGAALIPWPNRLGDGRYRFDGVDHRVPLTEPEKGNAIHGLLRWRPWQPVDHRRDEVTMHTTLHPMQGYPFALDVAVRYTLSPAGLTATTTARNIGDRAAPHGGGQHPYLSPGSGLIDDAVLQLDAATRIVTDSRRQLPTGTEAVDGTRSISDGPVCWDRRRSITRSPTWPETTTGWPGSGCAGPTTPPASYGWTRPTRSSNCSPATPSLRAGGAVVSAPSR
jgi:hypothetical protein